MTQIPEQALASGRTDPACPAYLLHHLPLLNSTSTSTSSLSPPQVFITVSLKMIRWPARVRHCIKILPRTTPQLVLRRHRSYLAPPFLLDDYIPRYHLLSSVDAAKKRSKAYAHLKNCNLCPRLCGVNRFETTGHCLIGHNVTVNTIAPHFGEGAVFMLLLLIQD
jgi:hypothetical protein